MGTFSRPCSAVVLSVAVSGDGHGLAEPGTPKQEEAEVAHVKN